MCQNVQSCSYVLSFLYLEIGHFYDIIDSSNYNLMFICGWAYDIQYILEVLIICTHQISGRSVLFYLTLQRCRHRCCLLLLQWLFRYVYCIQMLLGRVSSSLNISCSSQLHPISLTVVCVLILVPEDSELVARSSAQESKGCAKSCGHAGKVIRRDVTFTAK